MKAPKSQKQQMTISLSVITLMAVVLFLFQRTHDLIWMQLFVGGVILLILLSLRSLFRGNS